MDKPISVGDLVMVIGPMPCCGRPTGSEGKVFVTTAPYTSYDCDCKWCGKPIGPHGWDGLGKLAIQTQRLKRIPPLEELDDVKKDEEITA